MARATMTPAEFREKHARNTKAASGDMRRGVEAVTEAPGVKAAAAAEKMKANLVKSIDDGKWQRRVAAVDLDEWKDKMINLGIGRVSAGVDASASKVEAFYTQLQPFQAGLQTKIGGMPDVTLGDSINRMVAFVEGMATFEFKR